MSLQLPLIADFLDQLGTPLPDRNVGPALRALQDYLGRAPRLSDLTTETVLDFGDFLASRRLSAESIDRYGWTLRSIAIAAVGQGLLDIHPSILRVRPKFRNAKTSEWSAAELSRLFAAVKAIPDRVHDRSVASWFAALFLVALDTGLSSLKILSLPRSALRGDSLVVGARIQSLHKRTAAALRGLGTAADEKLFPAHRSQASLAADLRELLRRAQLPVGRLDTFRRFRITAEVEPEILDLIDFDALDEAPIVPLWRRRLAAWGPAKPQKSEPELHKLAALQPERTLRHFFEKVYIPKRLQNPDTIRTYRASVNRLEDFAGCEVTLDQLSDNLIEDACAWWRSKRSPEFLHRLQRDLCTIWRFARKRRYVETEPRDIDPIKLEKRVPDSWSVEELDRLLAAASRAPGMCSTVPAAVWFPSLISFLVDTGLRIGATLQLRVAESFDPERRIVFVPARLQKQKADQILDLSDTTVSLLLSTQPHERELLFPYPYGEGSRNGRLKKILKDAGLPHGRRDLWHKLRRSCCSFIVDARDAETARKILGHSDLAMTARYTNPRIQRRRDRLIDDPQMQRPTWRPQFLLGNEGAK